MAHLVLTVVGDDRAGLVNALAEKIAAFDANWEQSELAELAGAFAGIVLVSVADDQIASLTASLRDLDGLLHVTAHHGALQPAGEPRRPLAFTVLGNDRPGIVRDVTAAIAAHSLSIDAFRSRTLEAPMAGGILFEASVEVSVPEGTDASAIEHALVALAGEIQIDLTVG